MYTNDSKSLVQSQKLQDDKQGVLPTLDGPCWVLPKVFMGPC